MVVNGLLKNIELGVKIGNTMNEKPIGEGLIPSDVVETIAELDFNPFPSARRPIEISNGGGTHPSTCLYGLQRERGVLYSSRFVSELLFFTPPPNLMGYEGSNLSCLRENIWNGETTVCMKKETLCIKPIDRSIRNFGFGCVPFVKNVPPYLFNITLTPPYFFKMNLPPFRSGLHRSNFFFIRMCN
jgi:hypothetical protein